MNMSKLTENLSLLEHLSDMENQNKKNILANAKKEYKGTKIMSVAGTIAISAVCIGIMYLRFRVFGG